MGVSSDGVLYFGFQVGGDDELPEWMGEETDFDDFLVARAGKSDAPYEERSKIIKACPADLGLFCSYDYPMYVLFVRGAEHRAYRGDIVEIGKDQLIVAPEKIEAFKQWCAEVGVDYQEPQWQLVSMYG